MLGTQRNPSPVSLVSLACCRFENLPKAAVVDTAKARARRRQKAAVVAEEERKKEAAAKRQLEEKRKRRAEKLRKKLVKEQAAKREEEAKRRAAAEVRLYSRCTTHTPVYAFTRGQPYPRCRCSHVSPQRAS